MKLILSAVAVSAVILACINPDAFTDAITWCLALFLS